MKKKTKAELTWVYFQLLYTLKVTLKILQSRPRSTFYFVLRERTSQFLFYP